MERKYRILMNSQTVCSLYTAYEVLDGKEKKKSIFFFEEEIEKYQMQRDLKYNIKVFKNVNHPHVLKMVDYIQYDHGQEHVFEYFENNLQTYVLGTKNKLSDKQVFEILKQIILGVNGIIEKNFCVQNLRSQHFVKSDDKWKIKCVVFNEDDEKYKGLDSEYAWNKNYCPPEFFSNNTKNILCAEIVWSIGSIGLFLKEKRHKLTTLEAIQQVYNKGFDHLNPKLADFFKKTLNSDPKQRMKLNELRQFLINQQKAVHFQIPTKQSDMIEENLKMSRDIKLKIQAVQPVGFAKSSNILTHSINVFKDFSDYRMPAQLIQSRNLIRMSIGQSQYGKNTVSNLKDEFKSGFIKGSNLLLESCNSVANINQQGVGNQNYQKTRQWQNINEQRSIKLIYDSPQQESKPILKNKKLSSNDRELQKFRSLYREVDESNLKLDHKVYIKQALNIYRQQSQLHEFIFRLKEIMSNIPFSQKQKIYGHLAKCTFVLAAICNINPTLKDLEKGFIKFKIENPSIFKQSIYYDKVKNIYAQSLKKYLSSWSDQIQKLKESKNLLSTSGREILDYYRFLVEQCTLERIQRFTLETLVQAFNFHPLVSKIYSILKQCFSKNCEIQFMCSIVKLIIFRNVGTILAGKNKKVIFRQFFQQAHQTNPGYIFMLEYLEFLDSCKDVEKLKTHKQTICKHYLG